MELRSTFQSIISLHQEDLPFALQERSTQLPLDGNRIVTVTGIRRCGKSTLLKQFQDRLDLRLIACYNKELQKSASSM